MTTLVELRKLINESHLPAVTKEWALRRAPTFKRQSKLQEWINKFRNLNAERPTIGNRRQFQAYKPAYTEVTINVHKEKHNPARLALALHEDGFEPEGSDRTLLLPTWFARQLHGFLPDAKAFIEEARKIAPEHSQDQLATLSNFLASGTIRIRVIGTRALPTQLSTRHARSPRDRLLRDGDRRLTHPWLQYTASIDADNFAEMFTNPKYYYEDGCMFTAIMNTWADKWNSRPKKELAVTGRPRIPDITPESIHAVVFPGKPFNGVSPMSFAQAKPFFALYKVKARAYYNKRLVDEFIPPTQNKKLEKTLVILIKDDHAHHINDSRMMETISKREQHVGSMSSKYTTTKGDAPVFAGMVSSLDELFQKAQSRARETTDQVTLRFLWSSERVPLMNAIEEIFTTHHWLVKVQLGSNDQVTSFSMAWNNVHVSVVTPDFGQFARTDLYNLTLDQIQETYNLQHELRKCNGTYLLSRYAPGFADTLKEFREAPPYCKFGDIPDGTYDCIDQVKCYTTIIKDTPRFPKFSRFDRFEPYDGHIIEPLTLYVVEFNGRRTKAINCEFPANRCLKFGKYLSGHPVTVESFCRPHKTPKNPYLDQLAIIEKSTLPREITKMITNSNWGCLGKVRNTKKTTELCTTLEDAQSLNAPTDIADGPRGIITPLKGFYRFTINNQADLTEGFLPIQQLIYDEARYRLAKLVREADEANVLGVHTDCVYVKKLPDAPPPNCRFETKKMECKPFKEKQQRYVPEFTPVPQPVVYMFDSEFEPGFADEVLINNQRILIRGKYPGVGKTYLWTQFVSGEWLVACPSNAQAEQHTNGMTVYRLCGRIVDSDLQVREGQTADQVVFEEIAMLNSLDLDMVESYMNQHPGTKFIATGDIKQCEPIDNDWNPARSQADYYTDVLNSLFPVQIELSEIKRQTTPEAKELIKRMYDDFWVNELPLPILVERYTKEWTGPPIEEATNIAYRNEVVEWINTTVHGTREPYFVGLKLVYFREKPMGKVNTINKNCEVEIEALTQTHVTFKGHAPMPLSVLSSFDYTYAYTGHKIQGRSFDGDVIIYDAYFQYATRNWLWVALTRARDTDRVYRAKTPIKADLDRVYIQGKIDTHLQEDTKADRTTDDYIDTAWVLAQSKRQGHKCYNPLGDCSSTMRFRPAKKGRNDNDVWTVDRLDSRFAHNKSNCKLCCWGCNRRKKDRLIEG